MFSILIWKIWLEILHFRVKVTLLVSLVVFALALIVDNQGKEM